MYKSEQYNFEYVALVGDVGNTVAYNRIFVDLVRYAYPATYFDAGDDVLVGGTEELSYYTPLLTSSGLRTAPNLDLITKINWLGDGQVSIDVRVGYETTANYPPSNPVTISGEINGLFETSYQYSSSSTDPESEDLYYQWDWDDGEVSDWIGPLTSGDPCAVNHVWTEKGHFNVKVRSRDSWNFTSDWTEPLEVYMGCCVGIRGNVNNEDGEPGIDIADLVYMVEYQFLTGPEPLCFEEGDVDTSGGIDIGDLVYLVEYQFLSGPQPLDCF